MVPVITFADNPAVRVLLSKRVPCPPFTNPNLPANTLGFIYWPAVLAMAAASLFSAPMGAKLAHKLPVATLKKMFAALIIVLALQMLRTVIA